MKKIITITLVLLIVFANIYSAHKVEFRKLKDLVYTLINAIEANDYNRVNELVKNKKLERHLFKIMKSVHRRLNYRKMFKMQIITLNGDKFKLGGHSLGHIHIDMKKAGGKWHIFRIWMCR